jgi:hypothetical protein
VFDAIAKLQGVYAKAFLDLDNLEAVFGAIEMAQLICKMPGRDPASIKQLRENFVSLIVRTIEATTRFGRVESTGEIAVAKPYGDFLSTILPLTQGDPSKSTKIAFITFNYDIALDQALTFYSVPFDYCLNPDVSDRAIPLLKLHGSINWGLCAVCGAIRPWDISALPRHATPGYSSFYYNLGSKIATQEHCNQALTGPVLVPPTWNKHEYRGGLTTVWERAAKELGDADNIIIIGYSLPESDSFFRYLYAMGSASDTRLKRLWVMNPDNSPEFQARFKDMVGRGVGTRLRFFDKGEGMFEHCAGIISQMLTVELGR